MTSATVYFLVALLAGDAPMLSGMASFETLEACQKAADTITTELSAGTSTVQLVCVSTEALQRLSSTAQ